MFGTPNALEGVERCNGKLSFSTWAAATKAARRVRATDGYRMTPYLCRTCHRFHVGANVLRTQRR
jgi:hypothetical protein